MIWEAVGVSDYIWTDLAGEPDFAGFYAVMSESRGYRNCRRGDHSAFRGRMGWL